MHGGIGRTPNIDRFATEGVELKRYYGYPLCSPFYLQVAFNAPHFPLSAPEAYLAKYSELSKDQALNLKMDPREAINVWAANVEVGQRMQRLLADSAIEFPSFVQLRGPGAGQSSGPRRPNPG